MSTYKWTAANIPIQLGKFAIVNGATSEPGYQIALPLAGAGASVVLASRDPGKADRAMLMFGLELDRRLKFANSPISSIVAHRGVVTTEMTRRGDRVNIIQMLLGKEIFGVLKHSPTHGGWQLLFAATSLDAAGG